VQEYIRKPVLDIGTYILESSATVRQTADVFGVSKSIVQTVVVKQNGYILQFHNQILY